VSVQVVLRGQLGDNLFQYALGRIIASHHGLALECAPPSTVRRRSRRRRPRPKASTLTEVTQQFPGAPLSLPGDHVAAPVEAFELKKGGDWEGQTIPLWSVLNDRTRRQIRLDGYFQRFEYFQPHVGDIRRWFATTPGPGRRRVARNDVVLHIRRGSDVAARRAILPLSYYHRVLSGLDRVGRLHICGHNLDDKTLSHFQHYDPIPFTGTPIEQFAFVQRFDRIILSNSTSAWWAAFLSDASRIYAPRAVASSGYAFSGFREVDLDTRESRYAYTDVPVFSSVERTVSSNMRGARIFVAHPYLFVERAGHPVVRVDCQDHHLALAALLAREGELNLIDLERRFPVSALRSALPSLIRSGLVTLHSRYLEP
jgi:hypothetical protein